MLSYLFMGVVAYLGYQLCTAIIQLRRNIAIAKTTGLPYMAVPVYVYGRAWMIVSQPTVKLLRRLPEAWRPYWTERITPNYSWDNLYSAFEKYDQDTYMTVSPKGFMLWTANAEVVNQITIRRNDFPKPSKMYRSINVFGRNLVSAEGQLWRRHRKITSPPFTEKNNHVVWAESIHQADSMLKAWTGMDGKSQHTIRTVAHDAMRLSLHIISRAGFGVRLLWPGVETNDPAAEKGAIGQDLAHGHTMTYTTAIETLLHNLLLVVGLPHWILRR
jgi:hypothetical protein